MPRIKNETGVLLADLISRLDRLVATAKKEGREDALSEVRSLVGGSGGSGAGTERPARQKRKPAKKAAEPAKTQSGKPRKNPWANLTPKERLKRVNAIRKGRGLPLKRKL